MFTLYISISTILIAIIGILYQRRCSKLSEISTIISLIDKLYFLKERRSELSSSNQCDYNRISDIQLQMKHILYELDKFPIKKYTHPQLRLIADSYDILSYIDIARRYWKTIFNKKFENRYIEIEYFRMYGMFLIENNEIKNGREAFFKSVRNMDYDSSDDLLYFHHFTLDVWIKEEYSYQKRKSILHVYRNDSYQQDFNFMQKLFIIMNNLLSRVSCGSKYYTMCNDIIKLEQSYKPILIIPEDSLCRQYIKSKNDEKLNEIKETLLKNQ